MKIINAKILTDGHRMENYSVHTDNGKIVSVKPSFIKDTISYGQEDNNVFTLKQLKNLLTSSPGSALDLSFIQNMTLDLEYQYYIAPGFIDIHNHGAMMADAMDGTKEALDTIARFHAEHGVTTFLPTTMTAPLTSYVDVFNALKDFTPSVPVTIPGIHMEGPFLSAAAAGAQPSKDLLEPTDEHLKFLEQYHHLIKLMTVSPDVSGIARLMDFCYDHHITISGGHDSAIDTEVYEAINHHMASVTHIYCCSSGISRRNTPQKHIGLTQIGLLSPHLFCEVIADNCHVPRELFDLIYKCKGYQKICLVSDALRAAGMPPGQYYLGSRTDGTLVDVTEDVALLPGKNLFAGSITPIYKMVHTLACEHNIPLEEITYMASSAPADLLDLHGKGHIKEGFDSDFNVLSNDGSLIATFMNDSYIHFRDLH